MFSVQIFEFMGKNIIEIDLNIFDLLLRVIVLSEYSIKIYIIGLHLKDSLKTLSTIVLFSIISIALAEMMFKETSRV